MAEAKNILLERIEPDPKNRAVPDVSELAENMGRVGLINPICVRPAGGGRYRIVAGERRYRAALRLGWRVVACTVLASGDGGDLGEAEGIAIRLSENLERKKLSPAEEAAMVCDLAAAYDGDAAAVAAQLGKGKAWVRSRMKLARLDMDRLKEAGVDPDTASVKALEIFSDLPAALQSEILEGHVHAFSDPLEMAALAEGASQPLDGALFDRGECTSCQFNTANAAQVLPLFGEGGGAGGCTRLGCWKRKTQDAVGAVAADYAAKGAAWVYVATDIPCDWAAEARRARVELLGQPKSRWAADPEGDTVGVVFCGQGQGETVRVRRTVADSFDAAKARARALGIRLSSAPLRDKSRSAMLAHVLKWGAEAFKADGWKGGKGEAETLVRALTLKSRRDYLREGMRAGEEELLRRMAEVEAELEAPAKDRAGEP